MNVKINIFGKENSDNKKKEERRQWTIKGKEKPNILEEDTRQECYSAIVNTFATND